jgi:hypothetical protein
LAEADVIAAAHWRRGGIDGREPIAAPSDSASIASAYTLQQQYWGKITSKPRQPVSRRDLEVIAYRLGCTVDAAKRAYDMGLV